MKIAAAKSLLNSGVSFILQLARVIAFGVMQFCLPIKKNYWAFCTWPGHYRHTIDNPRAIFEEIKGDPSIKKIILCKPDQRSETASVEGVNVVFVDVESIKGAYHLARAEVVLVGYGLSALCSYGQLLSSKHKIVQLWHGIPLKRIGRLFSGESFWARETPRYAAAVCSSVDDQQIMAAAFAPISKENVWLCGLPRNDLILKPDAGLPLDYKAQLQNLRERLGGRLLVLYAPTWRASGIGIYPFSGDQLAELRYLLSKHNAAFGVRAHANRRTLGDYFGASNADSIFFVNEYPDVNVILREAAILVTDYSSIYIDFLITGRPILNFTYDIDEYVTERGFLYDLDMALPGPWFRSFEELIYKLEVCLRGQGIDECRYHGAKGLFHSHGFQSALQVTENIKIL